MDELIVSDVDVFGMASECCQRGDPVAYGNVGRAFADGINVADDVVARHEWEVGQERAITDPGCNIVLMHAGREDLDECLPRERVAKLGVDNLYAFEPTPLE